MPRLHAVASRYAACGVPTVSIDAVQNTRLADGLSISATPTVIVMRKGRTVKRVPKSLDDAELEELYSALASACAAAAPPPPERQEIVNPRVIGEPGEEKAAS